MKVNEFNNLVEEQLNQIRSVLIKKTAEYNLDEDRLSVFKRAGALQSESPEEALLGMLTKHIISIYDMVKSQGDYSMDKWQEKCIDSCNYLLLLLALEAEKENNKEGK